MKTEKAGEYAALICIIVAVLAGLAYGAYPALSGASIVSVLLVVLGVIVGFTTVSEKEVTAFLIVTLVFLAATKAFDPLMAFSEIAVLGAILNKIVANIALFVAPAALIVGFKAVYALASRK